MLSAKTRRLKLAQAALEHAVYFLELDAYTKVSSYLKYAADQFQYVTDDHVSMTLSEHQSLSSTLSYFADFPQMEPQISHK
ncbi:MAG: hypothetical protein F6K16_33605 [Symploca sp. SIO2B6]|nr:hypothetical protein [Symploca sp. SIO2B6]